MRVGRQDPIAVQRVRPGGWTPHDLDGDGDLDWVTSSFSGNGVLCENQGDGLFTLRDIFASPAAASGALLFDADNDTDLDMALIDEIADRVIVMKNGVR